MTKELTFFAGADLHKMLKGAVAYERAIEARKLFVAMDRSVLTPGDRKFAYEIIRIMANDASRAVRYSLSITLKSSPLIPHDVAIRLSHDTDEIALPIINASAAFSDEDLVEIIRTAGPDRQVAVATRKTLSERVTGVIADMASPEAVMATCANDNAAISERALVKIIDRFPMSAEILSAMAYRKILPLAVSERLITYVGEKVRRHLIDHHGVTEDLAGKIIEGTTERAVIDLLDEVKNITNYKEFLFHLNSQKRLTASLLLRAVAQGHMTFFEWGLSELAGVTYQRTWMMVHDSGPVGFKAIYERAGLPTRLFAAFKAGVEIYQQMEADGQLEEREQFQERMLQRFLTQDPPISREDLDYLLERLGRLSQDNPQDKGSDVVLQGQKA
jgi:uncharacterized protein (DUF2336 family)